MEYTFEKNRAYAGDPDAPTVEALYVEQTKGVASIIRVYVDESLRGQGIAAEVMLRLVEKLKHDGKKVTPVCPYAVKWFEKHKEYEGMLAK